jgi:CRISPR-associated protein Cmr1
MASFFRITADFEILTPMFLGGADQNKAELRAPSIKGALRFWYRALDPRFFEREPTIFGAGGEGAGQSLLVVRCREVEGAGDQKSFAGYNPDQFTQGRGTKATKGLIYLGYPFNMGKNTERRAINPGTRFSVSVSCHRAWKGAPEDAQLPLRSALASLWALGHLGALGSRSRRGFGALALHAWRLTDAHGNELKCDDLRSLPLLSLTTSPSAWKTGALQAIDVFRRWFGSFKQEGDPEASHHPHVGKNVDLVIRKDGFQRDWRRAMVSLGTELQGFRQRKQPDYDRVKAHVQFMLKDGGQQIDRIPERAAFGLPLTFRFSSVPAGKPVTFTPVRGERHGSPLLLRPVLIGGQLHDLFLRLSGDVPGVSSSGGVRGSSRPLHRAETNLLDEFMRVQKGKG